MLDIINALSKIKAKKDLDIAYSLFFKKLPLTLVGFSDRELKYFADVISIFNNYYEKYFVDRDKLDSLNITIAQLLNVYILDLPDDRLAPRIISYFPANVLVKLAKSDQLNQSLKSIIVLKSVEDFVMSIDLKNKDDNPTKDKNYSNEEQKRFKEFKNKITCVMEAPRLEHKFRIIEKMVGKEFDDFAEGIVNGLKDRKSKIDDILTEYKNFNDQEDYIILSMLADRISEEPPYQGWITLDNEQLSDIDNKISDMVNNVVQMSGKEIEAELKNVESNKEKNLISVDIKSTPGPIKKESKVHYNQKDTIKELKKKHKTGNAI